MNVYIKTGIALVCSSAIYACSGDAGKLRSDGKIKAAKVAESEVQVESGTSPALGDADASAADESVAPPSPITGAYLFCELVPDASLAETEKEVGCALLKDNARINLKNETQSFAYSVSAPSGFSVTEKTPLEVWDVQYRVQVDSPVAFQDGLGAMSFALATVDLAGQSFEFSSKLAELPAVPEIPAEVPAPPAEVPAPPPAEVPAPPPAEAPAPPALNLNAMLIKHAAQPNDCLAISSFVGVPIASVGMRPCIANGTSALGGSSNTVFSLNAEQNLANGTFCLNAGSSSVSATTCSGSSTAWVIEGSRIRQRDTNSCLALDSGLQIAACIDGDAKQIWDLESAP